jgi:hypothetical protein
MQSAGWKSRCYEEAFAGAVFDSLLNQPYISVGVRSLVQAICPIRRMALMFCLWVFVLRTSVTPAKGMFPSVELASG